MERRSRAIQRLFSLDRSNLEIEARVGRYDRNNNFTSGVKPYIFNTVRDQLLNDNVYSRYMDLSPSFNQEYSNTFVTLSDIPDIRAISRLKPSETTAFDFVAKKRQDLVDITEYSVRVAASTELNLTLSPTDQEKFVTTIQSIRHRERLSIIYTSDPFRGLQVDMTKVTYLTPSKRTEYQIEIEAGPTSRMDSFIRLVTFILKLNQGSRILMPNPVRVAVGKQYNAIMNQTLPPLQRGGDPFNLVREYSDPVDLTLTDMMIEEPRPYTVSIKADGRRMRIFISRGSIYLVDPPHFIGLQYMNLFDTAEFDNTVLEGEYVYTKTQTAIFMVYDCLVLNERPVGDVPDHMQRHEMARRVVDVFNESLKHTAGTPIFKCRLKEVVPGDPYESYNAANYILSRRVTYDFEDDGLIYTPQALSYSASVGGKIKKWKPAEKLTIDFAVKLVDADTYALFLIDRGVLTPFRNMTAFIPPETGVTDGSVVEMRWLDNRFEMTRFRFDKEAPNAVRTGENVWRAMQSPIPESEVVGEGLMLMRKWHLLIKKYWIGAFGEGATLLDVGSGQGGDILSWKENKDTIYAVEPNVDNMMELKRRMEFYSFKGVTILNVGAENTRAVMGGISTPITGVSLFSVLTYFFKSKGMLQGLVNTISSALSRGGKVHGLVLDGNRVAAELRKYGKIITPPYSITPISDIPEMIEYGTEIVIDMKGTMVVNQTEYLVNYELFRDLMVNVGFKETHTDIVSPPPYLNRYGAFLSAMHRTFAFEKVGGHQVELPGPTCPTSSVEVIPPSHPEELQQWVPAELKEEYTQRIADAIKAGMPSVPLHPEEESLLGSYYPLASMMVRIGIIGDGSCFIHAILRSFSSVYVKKSKAERSAYACTIRSAISLFVTPEIYNELPTQVKRKYSYSEYKEKIKTCSSWQGWESAYIYRLYFKKNIYIYGDKSGMIPLQLSGTCGGLYDESVILYLVDNRHYELLGVKVSGKLKTVFSMSDSPFLRDVHESSCKL
jgi:hypothetical protein